MSELHPSPNNGDINKDFLYGDFIKTQNEDREHLQKQRRLGMRLACKAHDLPMETEDMINAPVTKTGMGWQELLVIFGGAGAILFGLLWYQSAQTQLPRPIDPERPHFTDTNTQYEIKPSSPVNAPVR